MELALIVILKPDSKNIYISIKEESLDVMDEFLAQSDLTFRRLQMQHSSTWQISVVLDPICVRAPFTWYLDDLHKQKC